MSTEIPTPKPVNLPEDIQKLVDSLENMLPISESDSSSQEKDAWKLCDKVRALYRAFTAALSERDQASAELAKLRDDLIEKPTTQGGDEICPSVCATAQTPAQSTHEASNAAPESSNPTSEAANFGGYNATYWFREYEGQRKARIAEAITAQATIAQLQKERDAVWSHTCVHHTDAQRAAITCPVCALEQVAQLTRERDDFKERMVEAQTESHERFKSWMASEHSINELVAYRDTLHAERDSLRATVSSQAAQIAAKDKALKECANRHWDLADHCNTALSPTIANDYVRREVLENLVNDCLEVGADKFTQALSDAVVELNRTKGQKG